MEKNKQKIISIVAISIAVVALIANVLILVLKHNKNTIENNVENNLNEMENTTEENSIEEKNNIAEEETFVNVINSETNSEVISINDVNNEKNNEEKAIEIVKTDWGGEENTVFKCENNKDSEGRYIIEVRDRQTLNAKCYYHVNIITGEFEITE